MTLLKILLLNVEEATTQLFYQLSCVMAPIPSAAESEFGHLET